MCFEVKCEICQARGWNGCGLHKESVLANIPEDQRCKCPLSKSNSGPKPTSDCTDGSCSFGQS